MLPCADFLDFDSQISLNIVSIVLVPVLLDFRSVVVSREILNLWLLCMCAG